jgi:predicted nucleotide-binding protein
VFDRAVETGEVERFQRTWKPSTGKKKDYRDTLFSTETLKDALLNFTSLKGVQVRSETRELTRGQESWEFDTDEEFFAEYRRGFQGASLTLHCDNDHYFHVRFSEITSGTTVSIKAPTRAEVEGVFWEFDRMAESARIARPEKTETQPSPSIFIGHGRSAAWRDLKDHLVEQQGYSVQAYETGARSGHTIRDILDDLLNSSSFAILVLTGEDELSGGDIRPRQNVVHELGLFQGRLGFPRAIAVVEESIDLFSNMDGVQQIHFSKGEIRQVFGDVLATLRREFGDSR